MRDAGSDGGRDAEAVSDDGPGGGGDVAVAGHVREFHLDDDPTTARLDAALDELTAGAPRWCATGLDERIALLDELLESTSAVSADWVAAGVAAKGLPQDTPTAGEEWGTGPVPVLRNLALLRRTLADIAATGRPQPPAMREADGRVVVDVLPADRFDNVLFRDFSAEVWLEAGTTLADAEASMGRIYREGHVAEPGVALVLGAGNVSTIGPMDVLSQLFTHDRVVLLKLNPVNAYLAPHLAAALGPLIERDALRIVKGGVEQGRHLTSHPAVTAIHLTGSDRTYDAIVFGTGEEGRQRRARGERLVEVPVTAELGNVTPVIVVPGPWTDRDLAYQGDNIASMLVHNAGFNCVAGRMIVQHRSWSRGGALLDAVRSSLREATPRAPYYPGAEDRYRAFVSAHPQAERFGPLDEGEVPFTLIPALDPEADDDIAFRTEAFCAVMGEVALDSDRAVPAYIDDAVRFCNDQLWGTLSATIVVHPRSLDDPEVAAAIDRAIAGLRYGTVIVNHWPGVAFGFASTPWGAAPGSSDTDIQSGQGWVHNTYLLEDVHKVVVRGPFRPQVTPPWLHTNRRTHRLLPRLAELTATGSPRHLPGVLAAALRG